MELADAKHIVRRLIEEEVSAGFPFVRRIPSTGVWKSLAHIDALGPEERDVLFDILAARGAGCVPGVNIVGLNSEAYMERQKELVDHPAYERSIRTAASAWKYADPSFLRGTLDALRRSAASRLTPLAELDFGPVPLAVVEAAVSPVAASAAEIRKEVRRVFVERFRAKPTNVGSGFWNYPGEHEGQPFTLTLIYGGNFHKLRYGICVGTFSAKQYLTGATWEGMLGFGIGHWDFVCQHNLSQSVGLLAEIVERMVTL